MNIFRTRIRQVAVSVVLAGLGCFVLVGASARAQSPAVAKAPAKTPTQAPAPSKTPKRSAAVPIPTTKYRLDGSWPKILPNNWITANVTGLAVDKADHIWYINRPHQLAADDAGLALGTAECCTPAPSVLEFDAQGNLLKSWGGPGYVPDWPILEHGLYIDKGGNFWIGGNFQGGGGGRGNAGGAAANPNGGQLVLPTWPQGPFKGDRQELKFSPDGKLLLEIGHPSDAPANNQDTTMLGSPSDVFVDDAAHEVYIADGYFNRRVVVYDSNTGEFKRGWGAYGMPLSQISNDRPEPYDAEKPSKQFRGVIASIDVSEDGLVYVCDRSADRVQVFTKQGAFEKEFLIHPKTLGNGSCWSTTFSRDPQQKYLYVIDGENQVIRILNRADGAEVADFGHKGRYPGLFDNVERIAFDSKGNMYTAEVGHNTRIQKFIPVK